jgi:hypothetical protein
VTRFSSIRASRKRSIASLDHLVFLTLGVVGFCTGWKAQYFRPLSMSIAAGFQSAACVSRGSGAPISTHFSKSAITPAGNCAEGGILRPSYRSARISGLWSGWPGTTAAPPAPPLVIPFRESRKSPPMATFVAPEWHG